jgi:hypothetical protein
VRRMTLRTSALFIGISGTLAALIIDILRSLFHLLGSTADISQDTAHLFFGLLIVLASAVGLLLAPPSPVVAALLLVGAGLAFFFIAGWWALLASPLLLFAAILVFRNQGVRQSALG